MDKSKNINICVRNDRDGAQIARCRADLARIRTKTTALSRTYSLIGNEVRLAIIMLLHQERMLCVCDLGEILKMTVPAVSQHLRKLREGDIVRTERDGTTIYYSLSEGIKPMLNILKSIHLTDSLQVAY